MRNIKINNKENRNLFIYICIYIFNIYIYNIFNIYVCIFIFIHDKVYIKIYRCNT